MLLGQGREKNQNKPVFILNISQASRPQPSTDEDCLTTNITACCNYVKFKNTNRASNHRDACQMGSVSPPPQRADRREPRTRHPQLFCCQCPFPAPRERPPPPVLSALNKVSRGMPLSFLPGTEEKAKPLPRERPRLEETLPCRGSKMESRRGARSSTAHATWLLHLITDKNLF